MSKRTQDRRKKTKSSSNTHDSRRTNPSQTHSHSHLHSHLHSHVGIGTERQWTGISGWVCRCRWQTISCDAQTIGIRKKTLRARKPSEFCFIGYHLDRMAWEKERESAVLLYSEHVQARGDTLRYDEIRYDTIRFDTTRHDTMAGMARWVPPVRKANHASVNREYNTLDLATWRDERRQVWNVQASERITAVSLHADSPTAALQHTHNSSIHRLCAPSFKCTPRRTTRLLQMRPAFQTAGVCECVCVC